MAKTSTSFLLLFAFSVLKVKSQELCENYTNGGVFFPAEYCYMYCCGECNNRYCCGNYYYRLDQTKCVAEDCKGYYDSYAF